MRASPISGLLSATMISSDGTQFGFDFFLVQVDDRDFHSSQLVCELHPVHPDELCRFSERELSDLEKTDSQLKFQFSLYGAPRLAAGNQQIVGVLDCQFSHASNVIQGPKYPQDGFDSRRSYQSNSRSP